MIGPFRCSRGHTWPAQSASGSTAASHRCPACGLPALPFSDWQPPAPVDFELSGPASAQPSPASSTATVDAEPLSPAPASASPASSTATVDAEPLLPTPVPAARPTANTATVDGETPVFAPAQASAASSTGTMDFESPASPPASPNTATVEADLAGSVPPPGESGTMDFDLPGSSGPSSESPTRFVESESSAGESSVLSERTGEWVEARPGAAPKAPASPAPAKRQARVSFVGNYEVQHELGRGAMGVVYKARHVALNRVVALKMVPIALNASARVLARFQLEAEAVARLHHPNIVQIYEIGVHQGSPFIALEFVEGGTLTQRVSGGALQPREAAWVVQQLAQAMDSAHRCGIVHRDLKPDNILLTRAPLAADGSPGPITACVPKVGDFGLAKQAHNDSSQTQAGTILGTPSYMAPEQAEGRVSEVGPLADVYALGAILYDLLTGKPPFAGKTVMETLDQVVKLEPTPPRRLREHLPRDLETITLKCLQKSAQQRYASAGHLAEDLRRFLVGEPIGARRTPLAERAWKWCRRRPTLAGLIALSSAAALAVVVGGVAFANHEHYRALQEAQLHQQADEQRALAEANFQQAIHAVDVMLTRIGQERLEGEPRLEQVRRDLLEQALHFYDGFLKQQGDDPVLRWQTGRASHKVGQIRRMLGDPVQAEPAFRAALDLYSSASAPGDPRTLLRDQAAAWRALGVVLAEQGRPDAEEAHRQGVELRERLVAEGSPLPEDQQELALACTDLGLLMQTRGQLDEAEKLLNRALEIQRGVQQELAGREQTPEVLGRAGAVRQDVARLLGSLGKLHQSRRQTEQARRDLEESLALTSTFVGAQPTPNERQSLALAHQRLGLLLQASDPRRAEEEFRASIKGGEELAADFPTVPDYRQELAASVNELGVALLAQGRRPDADAAFRRSLDLKARLCTDFPRKPDYRRDLANGQVNQGVLLQTHNRLKDSAAAYEQAVGSLKGLVAEFPRDPDYAHQLGKALVNRATVVQMLGSAGEAESLYREALVARQKLEEQFPGRPTFQYEQARCQYLLATLLQSTQPPKGVAIPPRLAEAERLHRQARERYAKLAAEHPGEPEYAHGLAGCLNNLGDLLRATGKAAEGVSLWQTGIEVLGRLALAHPQNPVYAQEQARLLHNLGVALASQGKYPQAEAAHRQALALRGDLVRRYGQEAAYHQDLASSHGELAVVFAGRNRLDDAAESLRQGIAILRAAPSPDRPAFWLDELLMQDNLAKVLQALGQRDEADRCQKRVSELRALLAKAGVKV